MSRQSDFGPSCSCSFLSLNCMQIYSWRLAVLKDKLKHLKKCESLSKKGFEAGSLQSRRKKGAQRSCTKRNTFIGRRNGDKEVILGKKKSSLVIARLLSLRGWQGPSGRALTGSDQKIPIDWFKIRFQGETVL